MKLSTTSLTRGVLSLAALAFVASPAFAQSSITATDRAFLMKASEANVAEIASGKLAEKKGASPATRLLGKRFVDNHSANQKQLVMLAQKLHIMLPMHPTDDDKMSMTMLKGLSGPAFDYAYIDVEEKGHMKNIAAFKQEAGSTPNKMIAAYTKASLPVLEEHLMIATDDAAKMHHAGSMGNTMGGMSGGMATSSPAAMSPSAMPTAVNPVSGGQPGKPASTGAGGMMTPPAMAPSAMPSAVNPVSGGQPNKPTSTGAGGMATASPSAMVPTH